MSDKPLTQHTFPHLDWPAECFHPSYRRNGRVAVDSRPFPCHCFYVSPRPVTPAGVTFKRLRGIEEIMPVTDEMYQRMVGMLNMPPAPGKFVTIQVPDVPTIAGPDEQVHDE